MGPSFPRLYGTGTGADVRVPILKRAVADFAVGADWAPAAGDVKISKDGGAAANFTTLPTAIVMGNTALWVFTFSDAELSCKEAQITVADSATKTVEDQSFSVVTYGHASAMFAQNFASTATQTGDSFARIGAAGVSLSAIPDLAGVASLLARLTALRAGYLDNINNANLQTTVAQTGDSFARIGAAGVSLSAIPDLAGLVTLLARLSNARAGYLDNLNVGGNVASSAEATAIQNNTRVVRVVPEVIERPDSGTTTYRIELLLYDTNGNMEAPDSAPTVALVNQGGTDRSSRLDSATMALVSAGRYRLIYTADVGDTLEQLVWTFNVVEGGNARVYGNQSVIVDTSAVDFTAADRTKLNTLHDTRIPGVIQPQTGDAYAQALLILTALATVQADTDNLQTRLPTALIGGRMDSAVEAMGANTLTAAALATDAVTEIQAGLSTLNAAAIRTALGLASANLDTQLNDLPTNGELTTALGTADDAILTAIGALDILTAAEINAEIVDALTVDTYGELPQGAPGVTLSLADKINHLYTMQRNKKDNNGTETKLYADNGTTVLQKQLTSESAGIVTKAEWITGA